jgi:hypothetical protein
MRTVILVFGVLLATAPALVAQTLVEAVNLPAGTALTTGGSRPWVVDTAQSLDGAAAKTGAITHNQTSSLSITITGPAMVSYWNRVSTELEFDYLRVYDNSVELPALRSSGEVPWTQRTFLIGSGTHVIKWEFSKDEIDDEAGLNAVWLDQITTSAVDQGAPLIVTQPRRTGVEEGATATLTVEAGGLPPLQYQWRRGGVPLSGQTGAELTIPAFNGSLSGMYDCVVTNTLGSITTNEVSLDVVAHGAALDDVTRSWYGHGEVYWQPDTMEKIAGASSLRSGAIGDSQRSEFTASFTGPGTLRYWRKVSTEEGFDFLRVRVNGNLVHEVSGLRNWEAASLSLPAGTNKVSWSYEKNERFIFLDDAIWIDEVRMLYGRQNWLDASFTPEQLANPAVSGWQADPDHNGLANAFEYLLGRDPLSQAPAPSGWLQAQKGPLSGPGSGVDLLGLLLELPLTLPDDVTLVVENSETLMNWLPLASKTGNGPWTPLNGGLISEDPVVDGRISTRVYHPDPADLSSPTRFLRLKVHLPAP